jgi:hypothetical protein
VRAALAKQFEADRREDDGADEKTRKAREDARTARAMVYLEKIFQIPFWLRPLSSGEDGTFRPYIEMLAGESVEKTREKQAQKAKAASDPANVQADLKMGDVTGGESPGGGPPTHESDAGSQANEASDGEAGNGGAKLVEARRKSQLTDAEIAFLGSPEIAALAATAPRGVKRLVNVYRIARARRGQEDRDAVLGADGKASEYPLIALMAAVETGQKYQTAEWFYDLLKNGQGKLVDDLLMPIADPGSLSPRSSPAERARITEAELLLSCCDAAAKLRYAGLLRADDLLAAARLVRRYSFNPYR